MKRSHLTIIIAAAIVPMLFFVQTSRADDMGSMDMGGMTHQKMPEEGENAGSMDQMMSSEHMEHDPMMAAHMGYTTPRPKSDADQHRADEMVATLQTALAKYKDYHAAEAAGYKPWHPEMKQPIVHFTKVWYGLKAAFTFNPAQPTSLLYKRTPDGGYDLVGAMYTAPKRDTEDQLNKRVPLSVARWHRHINLCFPKKGADPATVDWTKFGMGSIATKPACDAAGGVFYPQLFGWMVHVYPWEKDPQLVWAH
jgi:hypothetical protein